MSVVSIHSEDIADPVGWAISELRESLIRRGLEVSADGEPRVVVLGPDTAEGRVHCERLGVAADAREAFAIAAAEDRRSVTVAGTDGRGVAYGVLELADRVRYATDATEALLPRTPLRAEGNAPVRGVLRAFACEEYDKAWLHDKAFWTEYLTHLASNRVNRFQLALGMAYNYGHDTVSDNYLCFAYPFLLEVGGFDVQVEGLSDAERATNLEMLRFISEETTRRGMHFQLGLWTQAYDQSVKGGTHRYPITGLDSTTHSAYCKAAVKQLLEECPAVAGITLRTHYEGGVEEQGRTEFWRDFFAGVVQIERPLDIDLHAKGLDDSVIELARQSTKHVIVSPKYWAEHQGPPYHQIDIRQREKSSPDTGSGLMAITEHNRRATRYGYADFLRTPRDFDVLFRVWPGTARVLLWADPAMMRGYGEFSQLGGALGAELCEPLTFSGRRGTARGNSRDPYADERLRLPAGRDWRKYAYTYRLWGRLTHNRDADPAEWLRYLDDELGVASADLAVGLASATRILSLATITHGVSASNNHYWPELYSNLPIANAGTSDVYPDTPAPGTFGAVSPLDPMLFYGVDEFADDLLAARRRGKYTPLDIADRLERLAADCDRAVAAARAATEEWSAARERWIIDVTASARLGVLFAARFRAGLFYSLYAKTDAVNFVAEAVRAYRPGADAAGALARLTDGVYRPDLTFGDRRSEGGHWVDLHAEVEADVADLAAEHRRAAERTETKSVDVRWDLDGARPDVSHHGAGTFVPAEDFTVTVRTADAFDGTVTLTYRVGDQNAAYQAATMAYEGGEWVASIPAAYTADANLLIYYFVFTNAGGNAWPYPGLAEDLSNQPYYTVDRATRD